MEGKKRFVYGCCWVFFSLILLRVVFVLFGGIAVWCSWVKFLEVYRRCAIKPAPNVAPCVTVASGL